MSCVWSEEIHETLQLSCVTFQVHGVLRYLCWEAAIPLHCGGPSLSYYKYKIYSEVHKKQWKTSLVSKDTYMSINMISFICV